MAAKWFKTRPHRALPDYPVTIWIDGGVQIQRDDFAEVVLGVWGKRLSMFRHPVPDNIADEGEFCIDILKYQGQPMRDQVAHYQRRGFPDKSGLYAGTVNGRDSDRNVIREFGDQCVGGRTAAGPGRTSCLCLICSGNSGSSLA